MRQTKSSEATGGIFSKISNKTDLKIYQIIFDLEIPTEEEIQKAGHFRTSDLTSGLKRLQSAALIAFDDEDVCGYYTIPIELVSMLSSLKSKNWKERDVAVRLLGAFLTSIEHQETEAQSFDKAVNALIKVMRTDKHMSVIFGVSDSLESVLWSDLSLSALGQKHKTKVIEACRDVSRKAVEIAVKCGATKVPSSNNTWSPAAGPPTANFSVRWGGTANNPRIDVSKCPWEAEVVDKKWENQTYAEMLAMIIYWREI